MYSFVRITRHQKVFPTKKRDVSCKLLQISVKANNMITLPLTTTVAHLPLVSMVSYRMLHVLLGSFLLLGRGLQLSQFRLFDNISLLFTKEFYYFGYFPFRF